MVNCTFAQNTIVDGVDDDGGESYNDDGDDDDGGDVGNYDDGDHEYDDRSDDHDIIIKCLL